MPPIDASLNVPDLWFMMYDLWCMIYGVSLGEKKAAESALFSARAELAMTNQLKQQVGELQSLEAAARNDRCDTSTQYNTNI